LGYGGGGGFLVLGVCIVGLLGVCVVYVGFLGAGRRGLVMIRSRDPGPKLIETRIYTHTTLPTNHTHTPSSHYRQSECLSTETKTPCIYANMHARTYPLPPPQKAGSALMSFADIHTQMYTSLHRHIFKKRGLKNQTLRTRCPRRSGRVRR
jgi:hypothetical protein